MYAAAAYVMINAEVVTTAKCCVGCALRVAKYQKIPTINHAAIDKPNVRARESSI